MKVRMLIHWDENSMSCYIHCAVYQSATVNSNKNIRLQLICTELKTPIPADVTDFPMPARLPFQYHETPILCIILSRLQLLTI